MSSGTFICLSPSKIKFECDWFLSERIFAELLQNSQIFLYFLSTYIFEKTSREIFFYLEYTTTKLVPRIRNWRYKDRLAVLGLTSLHERRLRGDLIQLFKLVNGINEVNWVNPPVNCSSLSQSGPARGIRGHARRLSGQSSTKCLQRANTFTNRVVNEWNALPAEVTDAVSVNQFKNRYDNFRSTHQAIAP